MEARIQRMNITLSLALGEKERRQERERERIIKERTREKIEKGPRESEKTREKTSCSFFSYISKDLNQMHTTQKTNKT